MAASEIETNTGKKKLVDNGFQFVFDKSSKDGGRLFWHCDQKQKGCPVGLHTRVEVSQLRTAIKRRAEDTVEVCKKYDHRVCGLCIPNRDANFGLHTGQLAKVNLCYVADDA